MAQGDAYVAQAKYDAALDFYIAALKTSDSSNLEFESARNTILVDRIDNLAIHCSDAKPRLEERRKDLENKMARGEEVSYGDVRLYARLNSRLGQKKRTLELLETSSIRPDVRSSLLDAAKGDLLSRGNADQLARYLPELTSRFQSGVKATGLHREVQFSEAVALFGAMLRSKRSADALALVRLLEVLRPGPDIYGQFARMSAELGDREVQDGVAQSAVRVLGPADVASPGP
jgi:hypothetical protein